MKDTVLRVVDCCTVGDLLDNLAEIAKDPHVSDVLDAQIEGSGGETFTKFQIICRTLSDKSKVLDFEFIDEA